MPLKKSATKKAQSQNISKLVSEKPWKTRAKAIKTIAKKEGITPKQAKIKQAIAISYAIKKEAKKSKKK